MDILIINLQAQAVRGDFQTRQMQALGLQWERLDAVSADTLSEATYQALAGTWERPMRKAEVCCFLSHKLAWEEVVRRRRACLILEDDAVLARTVPGLLRKLEHSTGYDLVNLEVRGRRKIVGRRAQPITEEYALLPLYQDRTGAGGYVLWPSGAQKLLAKAARGIAANADAFISSLYTLRSMQTEPAGLIQLDMCEHYRVRPPLHTETSIGNSARPPAEPGRAWRFKLRRIVSQLRMGWRALTVQHKARRRHIALDVRQFG